MVFLALAIFVGRPDTISFRTAAEPVSKVASDLSKLINVPISADRIVGGLPLIVSVSDVTASDLLARIADTVGAEIVREGSGFRITRTTKASNAILAKHYQVKEQLWSNAFAKRDEAFAINPWNATNVSKLLEQTRSIRDKVRNNDFAGIRNITDITEVGPASRALGAVLEAIGARALARIDDQRRMVLSLHPTSMQIPLPVDADRVARQYQADAALLPDNTDETDPSEVDSTHVQGDVVKMQVVLTQGSAEISLTGKAPDDADFTSWDPEVEEPMGVPRPIPKDVDGLKDTTLSPAALYVCQSLGDDFGGGGPSDDVNQGGPKGPSAEVLDILSNPERNDPLSLAPSEALLAYSEQRSLNVIALLSDEFDDVPILDGARERLSLGSTIGSIYSLSDGWKEDGTWRILKPNDLEHFEDGIMPRAPFGKLARLALRGQLSLDAMADFASHLSIGQIEEPLEIPVWSYCIRRLGVPSLDTNQLWTLRFIGGLTQTQRQALMDERGLSIATLMGSQIAWLTDSVYQGANTWDLSKAAQTAGDEVTDILPNGIPRSTVIHVQVKQTDGYLANGAFLTTRQIAAAQVLSERKPKFMPDAVIHDLMKARLVAARRTEATVHEQFTPDVANDLNLTMAGSLGDSDSAAVSVSTIQPQLDPIVAEISKLKDQEVMMILLDMEWDHSEHGFVGDGGG